MLTARVPFLPFLIIFFPSLHLPTFVSLYSTLCPSKLVHFVVIGAFGLRIYKSLALNFNLDGFFTLSDWHCRYLFVE